MVVLGHWLRQYDEQLDQFVDGECLSLYNQTADRVLFFPYLERRRYRWVQMNVL